jgi:GT2 family glycosyltransferase
VVDAFTKDFQPTVTVRKFSVGIVTRNRPAVLENCLASLMQIRELVDRVIVIDDFSDVPLDEDNLAKYQAELPVELIRHHSHLGYIVGRNTIAASATTEEILFLDDDTLIIDAPAIALAHRTLLADPQLVGVAFAQAEIDGRLWPPHMQALPANVVCYAPSFVGFAHFIRKAMFLELNGYREFFHYYGEEKDFCLRALEAGYRIIYRPDCAVAHLADASGRDALKCCRFRNRNDCYYALLNFPLPIAMAYTLYRVVTHASNVRKHIAVHDSEGRNWIVREIIRNWSEIKRLRKPVRYGTLRKWRAMRRAGEGYPDSLTVQSIS